MDKKIIETDFAGGQRFLIDDTAIYMSRPVKGTNGVFESQIVMPKEIFIEAFERWVKEKK